MPEILKGNPMVRALRIGKGNQKASIKRNLNHKI